MKVILRGATEHRIFCSDAVVQGPERCSGEIAGNGGAAESNTPNLIPKLKLTEISTLSGAMLMVMVLNMSVCRNSLYIPMPWTTWEGPVAGAFA